MKKVIRFSNLFFLELSLAHLIAILNVLGQSGLVSALFAVSFLLLLVFSFGTSRQFSVNLLTISVICLINVTICGVRTNENLNFDYFKKTILFLSFMFFLEFCSTFGNQISIELIHKIEILSVITGTVFVASYFFFENTATMTNGEILLGFANSNAAGMWLLHLIIYGVLFILQNPKKARRWLYIPIIMSMVYLLILTGARATMIALLFWIILLILYLLRVKINKKWCFLIAIMPIAYAIVYMSVITSNWVQELFSFMVSTGKPLTSRVGVWKNAFDCFFKHPILGDYTAIKSYLGQAHNTHIDVLCSYGIIPFLLFLKGLYKALSKAISQGNSFYQYAAMTAFWAVIAMGSFEAALVSGSMGLNLLSAGLLVLASSKETNSIRKPSGECCA